MSFLVLVLAIVVALLIVINAPQIFALMGTAILVGLLVFVGSQIASWVWWTLGGLALAAFVYWQWADMQQIRKINAMTKRDN